MKLKRIRLLAGVALAGLATVVCAGSATAQVPDKQAKDFRVALSVSPFTTFQFEVGTVYSDGTSTATNATELQAMFKAHGATEVFARASTMNDRNRNPDGSPNGIADHGLDRAVANGKIARDLGLDFNIELGVFRTYGDLLCQTPPDFSDYPEIDQRPWHELNIDEMQTALRQYGAAVATRFKNEGIDVTTWDIGNEIDFGFAGVTPQPAPGACDGDEGGPGWYRAPDAVDPAIGKESLVSLLFDTSTTPATVRPESYRVKWMRKHLWPYTTKLMLAVQHGIRSVDTDAEFSTHLSGSATVTFNVDFYRALLASGVKLRELGVSYYPTTDPDRKTSEIKGIVNTLNKRFGKKVFIAEFAYAAEPFPPQPLGGPFGTWGFPVEGYPISDAGAAAYLRNLTAWGAAHGISGIRPWAPDLTLELPLGPGLNLTLWEPLALFNGAAFIGGTPQARPGLDAIKEGLESGDPRLF